MAPGTGMMDKDDLYYQIASNKLTEQYQRGRGFDSRAVGIMGLSATVGGIAAVVLKDFTGTATSGEADVAVAIVLAMSVLATMLCSILALRPRKEWRHDPELGKLSSQMRNWDEVVTLRKVSLAMRDAITANNDILSDKGKHVVAAGWFLMVSALCLIVLGILVSR